MDNGTMVRFCTDQFLRIQKTLAERMAKKTGKTEKQKADFRFFLFPFVATLFHWYQNLGQSGPSMFWNTLNCNQRHEACKVSAQKFFIQLDMSKVHKETNINSSDRYIQLGRKWVFLHFSREYFEKLIVLLLNSVEFDIHRNFWISSPTKTTNPVHKRHQN